MNRIDLGEVVARLKNADDVLITTHTGPDGDAIGSVLGLRQLALALGQRRVSVTCHDAVPEIYRWLPGSEAIVTPDAIEESSGLGVIVDVAELDRIGDAARPMKNCGSLMVLDHHLVEDPAGDAHYIDPGYAAASEIVIDLFEAAKLPMPRDAAECLYVGIATDTGGFRFGNTNAKAHRRAAVLLDAGIDVAAISNRIFDSLSLAKCELLQRALSRLKIVDPGTLAYTYLTMEDMHAAKARGEDIEGIVNYARNLEGVRVGILFREVENGSKTKVSMRSGNGFNSAEILRAFGGGGHEGAAGATLEAPREEVMKSIVNAVKESLAKAAS